VYSFTYYTPGNMICDSQTSFLAHTFISPYLGCKTKVKVVTIKFTFEFYKEFGGVSLHVFQQITLAFMYVKKLNVIQ